MPLPRRDFDKVKLKMLLDNLKFRVERGTSFQAEYEELLNIISTQPQARDILLVSVGAKPLEPSKEELSEQARTVLLGLLDKAPYKAVTEWVRQVSVTERALAEGGKTPTLPSTRRMSEPPKRELPKPAGELPSREISPPADVGTRPVTPVEHHGGRDLGKAPPAKASAQAKEQREQEQQRLARAVSEAGERLETPVARARRVVQDAHRISEETGAPLSEPAVRLEAMLMVREETEREQGIPVGYEAGAGGPASMFVQDPAARIGLEAKERAEQGFDPERLARAEQKYRETVGALSRGFGARGGMSGEFDVPAYAKRLSAATGRSMTEQAAWAREHRPGTAERAKRRGKRRTRKGPRSGLYTSPSPLEMALRRRG